MKWQTSCLMVVLSISVSGVAPADAQYMGANGGGQARQSPQAVQATVPELHQWFEKYDAIRRQAQMSPQEKAQSDAMMSKGLSIFMPGGDKSAMQGFLHSMIQRYDTAQAQLKQLPYYAQTQQLHIGYFQYFKTAAGIFNDYIAVQNNPLAVDASGNSVAAGLLTRKSNLEVLDQNNKALDADLRQQFNIAPYRY